MSEERTEGAVTPAPTREDYAFPGRAYETRAWWAGMTTRAYLAGRALTGLLSASCGDEDGPDAMLTTADGPLRFNCPDTPKRLACMAAQIADALMAELAKPESRP